MCVYEEKKLMVEKTYKHEALEKQTENWNKNNFQT